MPKQITVWETNDGELFRTREAASSHEALAYLYGAAKEHQTYFHGAFHWDTPEEMAEFLRGHAELILQVLGEGV